MRTLQRYILADFLSNLLSALVIFTGFMFLANLLRPLREGFSLFQVLQFVHLYVPYVLTWSLPMSVLTASVVSFAKLAETGELTAIQSSGVHASRLMMPVLWTATGICVISFYANAWLIPRCRILRDDRMNRMMFDLALLQLSQPGGKKEIHLPPYKIFVGKSEGDRLKSVNIRTSLRGGEVLLLRAQEATFSSESHGSSHEARLIMFKGSTAVVPASKSESARIGFEASGGASPPREWTWSKNMLTVARNSHFENRLSAKDKTLGELFQTVNGKIFNRVESAELRAHVIEIHKRLSLSVVSLVFVLLGGPLGMLRRRSSRLLGFAWSLFLALGVYYPLLLLGNALAKREFLSPWMALWLPNLLFIILGLLLFRATLRA